MSSHIETIKVSNQGMEGDGTLYNWSGVQPLARKSQIIYPRTEQELSLLLKSTSNHICVVGSKLSYERIASTQLDDPNYTLIDMEHFKGLISIDNSSVTFGASTQVDECVKMLNERNYEFDFSLGVIGIQTIAGCISTGTHGQGLRQSSYADAVIKLRVVLANGDIREITSDTQDLPLSAFATSVGTLGVITQVTIRIAPLRVLSCKKSSCSFNDFVNNYEAWCNTHEFVKVWWFSETDLCHVWFSDEATPAERDRFIANGRALFEEEHCNTDMNDTIDLYTTMMHQDTAHDQLAPESSSAGTNGTLITTAPQFRTVSRFVNARNAIGYREQIWTKGIPVAQVNCEIAVPNRNFKDSTLALRNWARLPENAAKLHYPFIYRSTGGSSMLISPSRGPVTWIGSLVYLSEDGTLRADGLDTMKTIQRILAAYGGLPHWGKHFVPELYNFARSYGDSWKQFHTIRRRADPTGRLTSPFLKKIFESTEKLSTHLVCKARMLDSPSIVVAA